MPAICKTLLSAACLAALPFTAAAGEVVVFAAASLKGALDEIADAFTEETGHRVTLSYAGSGQLARQIIQGAPADIYISANIRWMDEVEKAGLLADGTRRDLLGNSLVLIAHGEAAPVEIGPETDLPAMLDGGRLAMGLVSSVPAGIYGKAALENLGLWDDVAADVAQTDNVRAALALVSVGEAPYGIVYATDAAEDAHVRVAGQFPPDSHPPIRYPVALLARSGDSADREFYRAVSGEAASAVFVRRGFTLLNMADE